MSPGYASAGAGPHSYLSAASADIQRQFGRGTWLRVAGALLRTYQAPKLPRKFSIVAQVPQEIGCPQGLHVGTKNFINANFTIECNVVKVPDSGFQECTVG